jgi:hypothetical protein
VNQRARVMCKHGHLHRGSLSAKTCEAAHAYAAAKKLGTDKLVTELREVLSKRKGEQ